jgi:RES domain-containing protein
MAEGREVFIARLNPVGTATVYSASLAEDTDERGFAIALAGQGQAYATRYTSSTNHSTANAFQSTRNRNLLNMSVYDALVAKINDFPVH